MRPDGILPWLTRHPQTKRELARRMGITTRAVEDAVQTARLEGAPILSDSDGYRVTDDPAEVLAMASALRRRYVTQALTARALRRTARRMQEAQDARLKPSGTLWDLAA